MIIILIAAMTFVAALSFRQKSASARNEVFTEDDRYYLPPSDWMRVFSLGYTEAAADLIWVETILYFGRKMTSQKHPDESQYMMNYLLCAVDLDPKFRNCYVTGSTLTLFQDHGKVSEKSIQAALELLDRGIREFPDDGELYFSLGFMHYYEMKRFLPDNPDDPKTKKHRELGRYYIGRAALMDGAPPYAAVLSMTLMMKGGMDAAILEHLKAMLLRETDRTIRADLIARIRAEVGKAAEADIAETERLQAAWRNDLPYVPYDFYLALNTDAPVEERLDPLYFSNQLLGLDDESSSDEDAEEHDSASDNDSDAAPGETNR
jgi:hypothetical protein